MKTAAGEVDLHRVRLMSLLNELVREHGQRGAAEVLEVDRKTLWRSMERGELSRWLTEALERVMTAGGGSAAARQRERFAALEKGMKALEGRVGSLERGVTRRARRDPRSGPGGRPGEDRRGKAQGACPQGRHAGARRRRAQDGHSPCDRRPGTPPSRRRPDRAS